MITTKSLSCSGDVTWEHGNSLINYMKLVELEGLTGKVKFDQLGRRTEFELQIVELKKHGLEKAYRQKITAIINSFFLQGWGMD